MFMNEGESCWWQVVLDPGKLPVFDGLANPGGRNHHPCLVLAALNDVQLHMGRQNFRQGPVIEPSS